MTSLSTYEKQRLENIEANKKMLESLGLLRSFKPILNPIIKKKVVEKKQHAQIKRKVADTDFNDDDEKTESTGRPYKRRSLRIKGIEPDGTVILPEEDDPEYKPKPKKIPRENYFGAPDPQFYIGYHWETRMECSADGIHRPTVAGIHGNESIGCYSIALSGGYEDDLDYGESFTFTGSGGRDLKGTKSNPKNLRTAPQSKDQTLDKMNLALARNVESREPVRVIRGYKLQSPFAPEYGYRYDGLYTVEKYWPCTGLSGFLVYKYVLKRVVDQPPPPWKELDSQNADSDKENEAPKQSDEESTKIEEKVGEKEKLLANEIIDHESVDNQNDDMSNEDKSPEVTEIEDAEKEIVCKNEKEEEELKGVSEIVGEEE